MERIEFNCETGEATVVEMTADEMALLVEAQADAATAIAPAVEMAAKRDRLDELKATGWANLTAAEKTEAQGLILEVA